MVYFTSDLHFGHENIIRFCDRPFENAEEMDKVLIENWNNTVNNNDTVYVLGDFTMFKDPETAKNYISQLKGKVLFMHGNHDGWMKNFDFSKDDKVKDLGQYAEVSLNYKRIILCHYPFVEWNHFYRGSFHFHGHQHNGEEHNRVNIDDGLRRYDVGVDANNFRPISIDEILEKFGEKSN